MASSCRHPYDMVDVTNAGGAWRSLVAHPAGGRTVAGSNPAAPTINGTRVIVSGVYITCWFVRTGGFWPTCHRGQCSLTLQG